MEQPIPISAKITLFSIFYTLEQANTTLFAYNLILTPL